MKKIFSYKIVKSKPILLLVFFIPFFLGIAGFIANGYHPLDAIYASLPLYSMKAPNPAPNLLLEIARWSALLATASGIALLLSSFWSRLRNYITYRRGDSVAVYGPEPVVNAMLEKLEKRGIDGNGCFVAAHRYILLYDEEKNIDFYAENREKLAGKPVYLQCSSLPIQSTSDPELRLFCPEETAARQYWKEHCLYDLSVSKDHRLKIVFIGFGRLGSELLTFGLQENIFHPNQRIEYHIFGDGTVYQSIHTQLASIGDPCCFYEDPWYSHLPLLEEADRVIVLTQEHQLPLLRELLLATARTRIDVFSAGSGLELLDGRERLVPYLWKTEAQLPDRIFSDSLYERAKQISHSYEVTHMGAPDTREAMEETWHSLNTFTRYSNISAADYAEIRALMEEKLPDTPESRELLAQLEHIRWCRYHYLNNWTYGATKDGKKDPVRRLHPDLIPYQELSSEEKAKDHTVVNAPGAGPAEG